MYCTWELWQIYFILQAKKAKIHQILFCLMSLIISGYLELEFMQVIRAKPSSTFFDISNINKKVEQSILKVKQYLPCYVCVYM